MDSKTTGAGGGRAAPAGGQQQDYRNFIGLTGQFEALIRSYLARRRAAGADVRRERGQVLTALAFVCGNYLRDLRRLGDKRPFIAVFAYFRDMVASSYALHGDNGKKDG
jgi:hypothetical protein